MIRPEMEATASVSVLSIDFGVQYKSFPDDQHVKKWNRTVRVGGFLPDDGSKAGYRNVVF